MNTDCGFRAFQFLATWLLDPQTMKGEAGDAERGQSELLGFKPKGHVASIAILRNPVTELQTPSNPEGEARDAEREAASSSRCRDRGATFSQNITTPYFASLHATPLRGLS